MPEIGTIPTETLERLRETSETVDIMDVASTDMTEEQESAIHTLAEAKAATIEDIVGSDSVPSFRFRKHRPVVRDYKIGRNDPCPCGSGLKYKKCCLDSGKYESTHTV